jgi:GAF domain-containing protein
MPRVPRPRVLPPPRSDRPTRARAPDPAMLRRIISTQGELSRAGLDPLKVVDIITRRAQELTRSSGAVVEMLDGSDMYYWSASGSAVAQLGLRIPVQGSLSGASVMAGRALRCDDSETDPRVNRAACRRVGLRSAIVLPLYCDDALVGVLKVLSPTTHAYRDEDVETLTLLGSFIGAALQHALEHEQLRTRHQSEAEV